MKETHQVKETVYMKEIYVLARYQDLCAPDGDALSHTWKRITKERDEKRDLEFNKRDLEYERDELGERDLEIERDL